MNKIDTGTIVRTVVLFVVWVNQFLVAKGYSPLPFSNEETELIASSVITFIVSIWNWWKNNNITRKARRNAQYLKKGGLE